MREELILNAILDGHKREYAKKNYNFINKKNLYDLRKLSLNFHRRFMSDNIFLT
jgi:hypothetical protein